MGKETAKKMKIEQLHQDLLGLTVLGRILSDSNMNRLMAVLEMVSQSNTTNEKIQGYSAFLSGLYQTHTDIGRWILDLLLDDENVCVKRRGAGLNISPILQQAVNRDLAILERLAVLDSVGLKEALQIDDLFSDWKGPDWTWGEVQLMPEYASFLKKLSTQGYGIWARHYAFTLSDGLPRPVVHPDPQALSHLFGYERQRESIRQNIEAFLRGKAWQNMLLYGDAGTGKSSTIKAFAKEYAPSGLRIIEVPKNQLGRLPTFIETLGENPLKFILFIDDLTFSQVDDDFTALKTTLEGGLLSQGNNVVVFATTNRRHLVKESYGERLGEPLYVNDGLQETMGLASRFGLNIIFEAPKKQEYTFIVESLAKEKGIKMPLEELTRLAEAYAIRNNGRSPRVAKQFIDSILLQQLPLPQGRF